MQQPQLQKLIADIIKNNIDCATSQDLVSDENNPHFLFCVTSKELLIAIANGTINAKAMAKKQLAMRGVSIN